MAANQYDLDIVEITVTSQGRRVWMTFRTSTVDVDNKRTRRETRMVKMDMALTPSWDEMIRLAGVMANFVIRPDRRHIRPPKALVWREMAFDGPETHNHGEDVDGRAMPMDPLPLFEGVTDPPATSTIEAARSGRGRAAPRSGSASAREPSIRDLRTGHSRSLPGG